MFRLIEKFIETFDAIIIRLFHSSYYNSFETLINFFLLNTRDLFISLNVIYVLELKELSKHSFFKCSKFQYIFIKRKTFSKNVRKIFILVLLSKTIDLSFI